MLLGSPIWIVRIPVIVLTSTEAPDVTGKSVYPFVTFANSRLGPTGEIYAGNCPGPMWDRPGRPW